MMPLSCSICDAESTRICAWCTKDACENHLCDKCQRCSDCCECEIHLDEHPHVEVAAPESIEPEHLIEDVLPEPAIPSPSLNGGH